MRAYLEHRSIPESADDYELYLDIGSRPRADGMAFLETLVDRFERSAAPGDCASSAPGSGTLLVGFELRRNDDRRRPVDPGGLTARFGGSLAATPLGTCLRVAIERDILAAPLPTRPFTGGLLYRRFEFPGRPRGR
jgi:hypothetical protein